MVMLGVSIMIGVSAWNGIMIYVTTQAARRDMARTVRTVVIADMHEAMESTRRELQLLNMATIQRLILLRFDDAALRQWVDTAVARVLAAHPQIIDIALYNTDNRKIRQARQSANLPEQLGADRFCRERDMLAYRVSVTALTVESVPRGALSAIILFPPTWFRRYEDSLDMQVIVTAEHPQPPHLHLMSKRIQEITPLATLRWAGSRVWFVYQIDAGEHSAVMTVMFYRNATHIFWGIVQAISVTAFMGMSFAGISTFFDADYRRVSAWRTSAISAQAVLQAIFDALPEWICVVDEAGNLLMQGEAMKKALRTMTVDVRELMEEPSSQFVWTLEGSSWLVTKVRLPLAPPQWVILARNITDMAAQQELLDRIITLTTAHLRELTKRRKSALIAANEK